MLTLLRRVGEPCGQTEGGDKVIWGAKKKKKTLLLADFRGAAATLSRGT